MSFTVEDKPPADASDDQAAWAEQWRTIDTQAVGPNWGQAITDQRAEELAARVVIWSLSRAADRSIGPFENTTLTASDVFWLETQWIRWAVNGSEGDAKAWLREATVQWWANRPTPTKAYSSYGLPPMRQERTPAWARRRGVDWMSEDSPTVLKDLVEATDRLMEHRDQWVKRQHAMDLNLAGSTLTGDFSGAYLWRADLREATLSQGKFHGAVLDQSDLTNARLSSCDMAQVSMSEANLTGVLADEANFTEAFLEALRAEGARFHKATFDSAKLGRSRMRGAILTFAALHGADLASTTLSDADLYGSHCEMANFAAAHLERVNFSFARTSFSSFQGATLRKAALNGAQVVGSAFTDCDMRGARLGRTDYSPPVYCLSSDLDETCKRQLRAALGTDIDLVTAATVTDFRRASFDEATTLSGLTIGTFGDAATLFSAVNWGGAPFAGIVIGKILGEESLLEPAFGSAWKELQHKHRQLDQDSSSDRQAQQVREAIRANREFANELRSRGFTGSADTFSYRTQLCLQRQRRQAKQRLLWMGWSIVGILCGYGYRTWRIFVAYAVAIALFSVLLALSNSNLAWWQTVVLAVTAFHGRGVSPPASLSPLGVVVAIEAPVGLVIEAMLVGTFLQRLLAR